MTCKDAVSVSSRADLLDQTLAADTGQELESHFASCEPSRAYLSP